MLPKYDYSIDALIKPGNDHQYFCFPQQPRLICDTDQFEISNACLLMELCRLVYRSDIELFADSQRVSLLTELLAKVDIEWLDCFQNEQEAVYAWLLKTPAFIPQQQKTMDCLMLIFRGTTGFDNWKRNADTRLTDHPRGGRVHSGFQQSFAAIENKLRLCADLNQYPLFISGHSLGAALAALSAYALGDTLNNLQGVYSFGSPKLGNKSLQQQMRALPLYRVVHRNDIVTMLPFDIITREYEHAGQVHFFDEEKHYIDYTHEEVAKLQQSHLPQLQDLTTFDSIISGYKNLERDIPNYLSDHAPINYLRRLQMSYENQ